LVVLLRHFGSYSSSQVAIGCAGMDWTGWNGQEGWEGGGCAEWRKQNPNKVVSIGDVGKPRPSVNQ